MNSVALARSTGCCPGGWVMKTYEKKSLTVELVKVSNLETQSSVRVLPQSHIVHPVLGVRSLKKNICSNVCDKTLHKDGWSEQSARSLREHVGVYQTSLKDTSGILKSA